MELKVGDVVQVAQDKLFPKEPWGRGKIVHFLGSQSVGVAFPDGHILGHSCFGRCAEYHGWWVNRDRITVLERSDSKNI